MKKITILKINNAYIALPESGTENISIVEGNVVSDRSNQTVTTQDGTIVEIGRVCFNRKMRVTKKGVRIE